jgi:hypothetical protein
VSIIIGECGVDNYVDMERWKNEGKPPRGWVGNIHGEQYANFMTQYTRGLDSRVVAVLPFLTDYRSNTWASFDTYDAHGALLSQRDRMVPQQAYIAEAPTVTLHIPSIQTGTSTSTPHPPADNWLRAYPFVLAFEGGLSLDPDDRGNYYAGELIGTKYGISAAVWGGQYDIRNLTKEQALDIYRQHYWQASGADKLPWPMCLIHFDTATNAGVGQANRLLAMAGDDPYLYLLRRLQWYHSLEQWPTYGRAWSNRVYSLADIVTRG